METPRSLETLQVRSRCEQPWDQMVGDDRVRHCFVCEQSVYNIAEMTRAEASALVEGREGRLCLRLHVRADGTILTADCGGGPTPRPPRPPNRRFGLLGSLVIILAALMLAALGRSSRNRSNFEGAVTWGDWVHWAEVSLGLKPPPPPPTVFVSPPQVITGDPF